MAKQQSVSDGLATLEEGKEVVCTSVLVSLLWAHLDRKEQFEVRKSDFFSPPPSQNCSVWAFLLSQHLAVPRGTLHDAQGTKSAKRCPQGQGDAQGKVLLRALETHKAQPCNSLSRTGQTGTDKVRCPLLCPEQGHGALLPP